MEQNRNSRFPDNCKLYFGRESLSDELKISGHLKIFSGYLFMGRPNRLVILTEVVLSLTKLLLQLKFMTDYADYAVFQAYILKNIYY